MTTKWFHINNTIIKELQNNGYQIEPYKINYLKYVPYFNYPNYFFKNNKETYETKYIKQIKSQKDLLTIFDVNNKLKQSFKNILPYIKLNSDIAKIDNILFKEICKKQIFPSELSLNNFPKASCMSINNIVCHGIPYKYNLKSGDIITIDVCGYNGYHSDMAETIMIGNVNGEDKKLVSTTRECLYSAISICKPGVPYSIISRIVEKISSDNGFDVIKDYGGHGIGKYLHMKPYISNCKNNDKNLMRIGDMFTIEPLIKIRNTKYTNSISTYINNDGISVLTLDGKNAAHFERTILITENGCMILNDI